MALTMNVIGCISLPAAADLSTKQFYAVKIDTNGRAALAGTGEPAIGILFNKPSALGAMASVKPLDGTKSHAVAGGTITAGDLLAVDSAGKLKTAVKATTDTSDAQAADALIGSHVIGVALESAVLNDVFQFLPMAMGAVPTTAA